MKTLIIIATYNEYENIKKLLPKIFEIKNDVHILVIDDASPDGTHKVVQEYMQDVAYQDKLFLMQRAGKLGLGTAYIAGFNWALERDYEVIMHMDADFSHNPKYIPTFIEEIKTNDLVLGSRYVKGGGVVNWGLFRKFLSYGGSTYSRIILGLPIRDLTGGFKCFRRKVLETIGVNQIKSGGFSFQVETTYKTYLNGFKIKEIPIIFEDREVGQSKMSKAIFFEALLMIIKLKLTVKK
jgi:dolichol-phosphate mannosyltransferase